jgi:hypothetical protein
VGVTVQIPYELETAADACPGCTVAEALFGVAYEGNPNGFSIFAAAVPDNVRILRIFDSVLPPHERKIVGYCESITAKDSSAPYTAAGLPCPPLIYHGDGSLVLWDHPAKQGEELVAYAVGLGRTSPPSLTGKVVTSSAPTASPFGIDFNYRPNALASRPPAKSGDTWEPVAEPLYTGTLEGNVGIYQIRFRVPPVPADTPACSDLTPRLGTPYNRVPVWNRVYTNLTVSVGGRYSFDGAGICVAVEELTSNEAEGTEQ